MSIHTDYRLFTSSIQETKQPDCLDAFVNLVQQIIQAIGDLFSRSTKISEGKVSAKQSESKEIENVATKTLSPEKLIQRNLKRKIHDVKRNTSYTKEDYKGLMKWAEDMLSGVKEDGKVAIECLDLLEELTTSIHFRCIDLPKIERTTTRINRALEKNSVDEKFAKQVMKRDKEFAGYFEDEVFSLCKEFKGAEKILSNYQSALEALASI